MLGKRRFGYFQRSVKSRQSLYVGMGQHLVNLSQLWQIKIASPSQANFGCENECTDIVTQYSVNLYNLTGEQLGKHPEYPSSQTKRMSLWLRSEWVALMTPFANFFHLFPRHMNNSLTKTSAIKTFPKTSSFKRSSGNFGTPSSFPSPKPRTIKQGSIKMFVLRLFGKFVPFYFQCVVCHVKDRGKWGTQWPTDTCGIY